MNYVQEQLKINYIYIKYNRSAYRENLFPKKIRDLKTVQTTTGKPL